MSEPRLCTTKRRNPLNPKNRGYRGSDKSGGASRSVLQATNTKQVALNAAVPACVLVVVAHAPVVGAVAAALVLTGTPPDAEVADIVEIAIGIAVATRKGGKAVFIRAVVASIPAACSL